jgi:hypothetical protein
LYQILNCLWLWIYLTDHKSALVIAMVFLVPISILNAHLVRRV